MLDLIVEAAQHAFARSTVILLNETDGQPRSCECILVEELKKKTPVIPKDPWHDQAHTGKARCANFKAG